MRDDVLFGGSAAEAIRDKLRLRRESVITEAYYLLWNLSPGERPSRVWMDRGEFHLAGLAEEARGRYSDSQLAHQLAQRLIFNPRKGFWARLAWLSRGDA